MQNIPLKQKEIYELFLPRYKTDMRMIKEATINLEKRSLQAKVQFPTEDPYLRTKPHHINSSEMNKIFNQTIILFYQNSMLWELSGFPHVTEDVLKRAYEWIMISREEMEFNKPIIDRTKEYGLELEYEKKNGIFKRKPRHVTTIAIEDYARARIETVFDL